VSAKAKVKRTRSRATMKRLIRDGWELQGVEGKKIYNAMSWGGTAYILVKKPQVHETPRSSRTERPVVRAVQTQLGDLRIGCRVLITAIGYRNKTGIVTKMTERNLTVRLDDGRTARMIPPNKVQLLADE
jgi:hypothetical protein